MTYKIKRKSKLTSGYGELLLVQGVKPRTKIKTLEKKYKADFRRYDEKRGTATLYRSYKKRR